MHLRNLYYPFDEEKMNLKVNESAELIEREKPRLVIFGASFILFPAPVRELSKIASNVGAEIAFDGAHVLGLIAGGKFQDHCTKRKHPHRFDAQEPLRTSRWVNSQ